MERVLKLETFVKDSIHIVQNKILGSNYLRIEKKNPKNLINLITKIKIRFFWSSGFLCRIWTFHKGDPLEPNSKLDIILFLVGSLIGILGIEGFTLKFDKMLSYFILYYFSRIQRLEILRDHLWWYDLCVLFVMNDCKLCNNHTWRYKGEWNRLKF